MLTLAQDKLSELEAGDTPVHLPAPLIPKQPDFFQISAPHPAIETLKECDLDALTPREALEVLYRLKDQI